ncbi:MAG: flippase [Stygiobacter sp.]|nr:MAG: flippase [Stygiobacter sp.]
MASRLFTNIIIYWIIARFYGKEIFGQFTSAQSIAIAFILFADFGLDLLLTTELPKNISNRVTIFNQYFLLKIVFSLIAFVSILLLGLWSNFSQDIKNLILIFSPFVVFTTLTNFLSALYKGSEKLEYETFVNFTANFISLIVMLMLIFLQKDIFIISIAFTLTKLTGLIIAVFYATKIIPFSLLKFHFGDWRQIKNRVIVFGVFWIFGNLFFQIDTILLSLWGSIASVGVYQSAFKLVLLPLVIPDIFVNSLMPTLSRLYLDDPIKGEKLASIFNKLLVIVSIPISVTLFMFPEQILTLIYGGKEYYQAVHILQIFAIILFVRFFSETYGLLLTISNRQKIRMYIVVIATAFNLIINFFLIPYLGALGASITSLITNVFVGLSYIISTPKQLKNLISKIQFTGLTLITIFIIIIELFIKMFGYWYLIIFPIIIYLIYSYLVLLLPVERKYISEYKIIDDIKIFKNIIP